MRKGIEVQIKRKNGDEKDAMLTTEIRFDDEH